MLFSAINYPLCFWEGTRKKLLSAWSGGCSGEGLEKLLLAGASVMKTLLFGNVTPAAPIEVSSALGEDEGTQETRFLCLTVRSFCSPGR